MIHGANLLFLKVLTSKKFYFCCGCRQKVLDLCVIACNSCFALSKYTGKSKEEIPIPEIAKSLVWQ